MRVRAITVDFWGTLLFDGPGSDNRYKRRRLADFGTILDGAGLPASPAALDRGYEASAIFLREVWRENRDVPVREHVRAILQAIDAELPSRVPAAVWTALLEAYARPALTVPPDVDPDALAVLRGLCDAGYRLALVSNTMRTPGTTLRALLERYGLLGCFAHTSFSDEVGVRKPAPEIFAVTLRALGCAPAEAVHVGDDVVLDVEGARGAGMRVVQVTGRAGGRAGTANEAIPSLAGLPTAIRRLDS